MSPKHPKTTSPTAEQFAFARLYWEHGSATKAGVAMWPELKAAGAKGVKWAARADVKLAIEAVREAAQDRIRAEYLENDCGLSNIIALISGRLNDPATPAREFLGLATHALEMQGHAPKNAPKERPPSGNALAALVAQSAGLGAALGASIPDGRLSPVRAALPEDQEQTGPLGAYGTLAAPSSDVGRPEVANGNRTGRVAADIEISPRRV